MRFDRELLKGHLKVILLAVLDDNPCHAYGLKKFLQEKSLDVFNLSEGTLYPSLHKLERAGLISSTWEKREKGSDIRKYHITPKGKKVLEESKREWIFFSRAMSMVLKEKSSD